MNAPTKYLGFRWKPDFNCWDFVCYIYDNEFGIKLQPQVISVSNAVRDAEKAIAFHSRDGDTWETTEQPVVGDVAVFGRKGLRYHVGVLTEEGMILHLSENTFSCFAKLKTLLSGFDTVQFYHHKQRQPVCQDSPS